MKKILFSVLVIIILVAGGFFLQNKDNLKKVRNIVTRATPTPTPTPEIDPSSLTWIQTKTSAQGWPKRDSHSVFVFDNKMWVLGGLDSDASKVDGIPDYESAIYYNDIWNTSDGVNWTRVVEHADFPYIRSASVVNFKGTLYMYGGWSPHDGLQYKNGIWSSTDGIHWKKVVEKPDYPEREGQIVLEWNGKLWLVGGVDYFGRKTFNDVWSSDDGIHWGAVTTNAPWHSRWDHALGVWNGKMYIAGGMNFGGVGYSDEWSSSDGEHWDLVNATAPWGERQGQEIVNYRGLMWLIGGLHSASNEGKGDAWYSTDGIEWTKAPDDYEWKGREDHGVIVFNDKIWVMGGMDSNWNWNGDVWSSSFQIQPEIVIKIPENLTVTPKPDEPKPQTAEEKLNLSATSYFSKLVTGNDKPLEFARKNINQKLPIASVTKLMTALVAVENIPQNTLITIDKDSLAGKGSAGEIHAGEIFDRDSLLTILLLPSDNDSAFAFAEAKSDFVVLMNAKAQTLGMKNTYFGNPAGLDSVIESEVNYSTASDLFLLAENILKNHPEILTITRNKEATVTNTAGVAHHLINTDKLLSETLPFLVLGGKTGETPMAKKNLVLITGSMYPDTAIISIILHSDDNFGEMKKLLNSIIK
ncbi:MAG: hypothetical protein PHS53_03230 [Candidatus Pacebacteria bacterium]|nr:hypothetical protein [Candidatus Paceibacterota bacterium]MDD5357129.1 hypothetical protein [Candidatus Paceibacterota bacterium]